MHEIKKPTIKNFNAWLVQTQKGSRFFLSKVWDRQEVFKSYKRVYDDTMKKTVLLIDKYGANCGKNASSWII